MLRFVDGNETESSENMVFSYREVPVVAPWDVPNELALLYSGTGRIIYFCHGNIAAILESKMLDSKMAAITIIMVKVNNATGVACMMSTA